MSAFFGVYDRRDAALAPGCLAPALHDLAYQARDRAGSWQPEGSPAAFGHAMTCLTPQSLDEQLPYEHSASGLVISADARLANRAELAAALGIPPADADGMPDSLYILRAYQAWGDACPERLEGDFAFAIWDKREYKLFCARDPLGICQFYYTDAGQRLAFSSDLYGLLALLEEAPRLDLESVAAWMRKNAAISARRTFFSNVLKLQPGQALAACRGVLRTWDYWVPEDAPAIRLKDEDAYAEALRELLTRAVEERTRSSFALGAHLSGGLDSSSIAVLAGRKLRQDGKTLTAISWSPPPSGSLHPNDERNLVAAICAREGFSPLYTRVSPEEDLFLEICDPSLLPSETIRREYAVMKQAAGSGIRLLLSGWGGDELVTYNGRGYMAELFQQRRWSRYIKEVVQGSHLRPGGLFHALYRQTLLPLLPENIAERMPFRQTGVNKRFFTPELLASINLQKMRSHANRRGQLPVANFFQPEFLNRLAAIELPAPPSWQTKPGVHANQLALLRSGHLVNRIESWAAHGARFGIAYTYPLLDRRLVEFALGVPADLFYSRGIPRFLARKALEGILPPEVQWNRNKVDPSVSTDQKTPEHKAEIHRLRSALFEDLIASQPHSAEWVNFDYLRKMLNTPPGDRRAEEAFGIWNVLGLAFMDKRVTL